MYSGPEQLKDWMERREWNQAETAAYFGCDISFISQLINRRRTPGLANAILIERKTGIPVEAWASSELDKSAEPVAVDSHKPQIDKA
jgi:transcriptional regulator with XRE-family HTH domain